jgi:hypothetical protein
VLRSKKRTLLALDRCEKIGHKGEEDQGKKDEGDKGTAEDDPPLKPQMHEIQSDKERLDGRNPEDKGDHQEMRVVEKAGKEDAGKGQENKPQIDLNIGRMGVMMIGMGHRTLLLR